MNTYKYQVIEESETFIIKANSVEEAVKLICRKWEMLEDCIETIEEVQE